MKELLPFEYTPDYQPFDGEEISFRLKPLDQRGSYEIEMAIGENGMSWAGIEAASRYIVGWKGESLGEFSRARVRQILYGSPDSRWRALLGFIAGTLYKRAHLEDDAAKKS